MVKGLLARSRRLLAGTALCAAVVLPVMTPKPAQAWWGWRGGVAVAFPPVVVGAPVYAPAPYYYPYAPAYVAPYWHWVPERRTANGGIIAGHWEH